MISADPFTIDIKYLRGVGSQQAQWLASELNVHSVRDLLYTFPYKYIDRSTFHTIATLRPDLPFIQLRGQILSMAMEGTGSKRRLKAIFSDGTGQAELVWFRSLRTVEKSLRLHRDYVLLGKPSFFQGRISFAHPELDSPDAEVARGGFQAVYSITERMRKRGITSRKMACFINEAFSLFSGKMDETLPPWIIASYGLTGLYSALLTMHFPRRAADLPEAQRRLKFEELFFIQLDILHYAEAQKRRVAGFPFPKIGDIFNTFYSHYLPFPLTEAQKRVIREVRRDVGSGRQMNRLLQGDVGSGKTIVALMCCLMAFDNGFQACVMAPTEILAEQHMAVMSRYLASTDIRVALLTGQVTRAQRRDILRGVADGSIHLLIGTHALIEPTVVFLNLGLAIVDEQHRFGVKQRASLWSKNQRPPHVLVMTATPIPRTLAMTVYGDLDVSVIDELPPGRKPVRTFHYSEEARGTLYQGMRLELQRGRQVYVVYPLIEESEALDLQSLEEGFEQVRTCFPDFRVGKLHGRMPSEEKEAAMRDFLERRTQILVATTVIEVGVDVPNASVMVVESANRFGLAQLHQLRGRVGRGAEQSYCLLMTKGELSEAARRRMDIMVETNDGFRIAEEDMRLRGPGDLEGTQQSGLPFTLRIANLVRDAELMQTAREAAATILAADPELASVPNALLARQLQFIRNSATNFSAIS